MSDWSAGYVTDIAYIYGVYRELVPAVLNFAVHGAGFVAPEMDSSLTYCELGCGQGFSVNLLAAANPRIDFHATDFNPTHIAGARSLAAAAELSNIHFYDRSFADFGAEPGLPEFDFITLHGIYSWISAENRRHIIDFIDKKLKIGGIVYISYNALPGWAPILPLRHLIDGSENGASTSTMGRVEHTIAYLEKLAAVSPTYFRLHPGVTDAIERIKNHNRNYVAHEYFNRHLQPFYHREVAADLAEAKLTYVGSANLTDNLTVANLTAPQQAFLSGITNASERETLRDFIVNQRFRRDIFIKGALPLQPEDAMRIWDKQRFVLTTRREDVSLKIAGAAGEATLKEEVYSPLLDALEKGPTTTAELLADEGIAAVGRPSLVQALTVLVSMNHLQPALDAVGERDRAVSVDRFNDAVMRNARSNGQLQHLASPVTGSGVGVERIPQLFLAARREGHQDPPAFAWEKLSRAGHRVTRDGKPLETPEENIAELRELFQRFSNRQLLILQSAGIA